MLSAQGIAHTYGAREALRGVDLDVKPGEIVALLGPNGAGKSTLLQVLAGLLRPTAGHADVAGVRVPGDARKLGGVVGFVPQGESLYPELTVRETLKFFAGMHGAPTTDAAITRGLARVSLAHRADTRVGELSGGLRQRLALAASLAHEPRVLLLDEPGTGLDPSARARLATMLRAVRDDKRAVLLSTHSLDEAARVADRVVFLVAGRVESTLAGRDAQRLETRFRELEVDA